MGPRSCGKSEPLRFPGLGSRLGHLHHELQGQGLSPPCPHQCHITPRPGAKQTCDGGYLTAPPTGP